jgi:hypothetical protein
MKSFKEVTLGICAGWSDIDFIRYGAVSAGKKWRAAYFIAGAVIAAEFLQLSTKVIQ